jgi:N-methylhydantoinase B
MTIPNVEVYERKYPIHVLRQEYRRDGGGAGEWRGGTGVDYRVRFLENTQLILRGDGMRTRSGVGIAGGRTGMRGDLRLTSNSHLYDQVPQYGVVDVAAGTTMELLSAGGGGWGDPARRDIDAVAADVRDGLISVTAAAKAYNVVLTPGTFEVDRIATGRLRTTGSES